LLQVDFLGISDLRIFSRARHDLVNDPICRRAGQGFDLRARDELLLLGFVLLVHYQFEIVILRHTYMLLLCYFG